MGPLDKAIKDGFSITGVSTWFSYELEKPQGTRHLQIVYVQKGVDVKVLYQDFDSAGKLRWREGDL